MKYLILLISLITLLLSCSDSSVDNTIIDVNKPDTTQETLVYDSSYCLHLNGGVIVVTNNLERNLSYANQVQSLLEVNGKSSELFIIEIFTDSGEIISQIEEVNKVAKANKGAKIIAIERYSLLECYNLRDSIFNRKPPVYVYGPVTQREFDFKIEPDTFQDYRQIQEVGVVDEETGIEYTMETFFAPIMTWLQTDTNINSGSLSIRATDSLGDEFYNSAYGLLPYKNDMVSAHAWFLTEIGPGRYNVEMWLDDSIKVDEVPIVITPRLKEEM